MRVEWIHLHELYVLKSFSSAFCLMLVVFQCDAAMALAMAMEHVFHGSMNPLIMSTGNGLLACY